MINDKNQRAKVVIAWLISQGYAKTQYEVGIKYFGINSKSYISRILNSESPISDLFLLKLAGVDKRINYDWLQTGYGNMLGDSASAEVIRNNMLLDLLTESQKALNKMVVKISAQEAKLTAQNRLIVELNQKVENLSNYIYSYDKKH